MTAAIVIAAVAITGDSQRRSAPARPAEDAIIISEKMPAPAGQQLKVAVKRLVNEPTLAFPWDRG